MTLRELIEHQGDWVWIGHYKNIDDAVCAWEAAHMSLDEIKQWLNVGCARADAAMQLRAEGITPDRASAFAEPRDTIAYLFSERCLSIEDVRHMVLL